jgi:DNA-binding transcriptional LysR family regulator
MIDDLRAMAVFAKTVESGSFRAAATAMNLSPSVVSHHVSQLEERLGVALLYRSTRRLSLTQDGIALFEHAKLMLAAAENGLNAITRRSGEPIGTLSVTLPAFLARSPLVERIAEFAKACPKVRLAMDFSDLKQDLIRDAIDLAIRIGPLQDSGLKSRKLFDIERRLVIAPAAMGKQYPLVPEDLRDWSWIGLRMRPNHRTLTNAQGEARQISFEPRVVVNSLDAVCQLAIAGLGLATPPAFLVEDDIRRGRLVEPLSEWSISSLGAYAVWPPNAARESLTYRLVQFLQP